MKVSEAIDQLLEFQETFGDIEVVFDAAERKPIPTAATEKNAHVPPQTIAWINSIHGRN